MAKITFENSSSSSSSSWSILTSSNTSHSIFNRLINIVFKEKKENCSARVQLCEMLSQLESLLLLRFSFTHCLRMFTIKNSVKSFIELLMHPSKKSGISKLSLNIFSVCYNRQFGSGTTSFPFQLTATLLRKSLQFIFYNGLQNYLVPFSTETTYKLFSNLF